MIYIDIALDKFLKKTGIITDVFTCPKCKNDFETVVPCVTKDYYGLQSEIHACGDGYFGVVLIAKSNESKKTWAFIGERL